MARVLPRTVHTPHFYTERSYRNSSPAPSRLASAPAESSAHLARSRFHGEGSNLLDGRPSGDLVIWASSAVLFILIFRSAMNNSTGRLYGIFFFSILVGVISGTDPITTPAKLRDALPRAPENQLCNPVMLLGHPKVPAEEAKKPFDQLQFFHELVICLNKKIQGFKVTVSEIWFVEYNVFCAGIERKNEKTQIPPWLLQKLRRFRGWKVKEFTSPCI